MFVRSMTAAVTGGGRYSLDAPVAALAGLSVAFLAFAAPADLLADLAASSGLSGLLPDGESVGIETRIGVGAAGAVAVFAFAFLLLRWLDRFGTRPAEPRPILAADEGLEPPRLRRRDFHPDAPPRPPLMATRELGEPAPPARPSVSPDVAEAAIAEPAAPAPDPWPTSPAPERPNAVGRAPEPPAPPPAEPPSSPPPAPTQDGSLNDLMARLEQGLARRRTAPPPAPAAPAPAPPPPAAQPSPASPSAADDRLQSAIASLQRLAAQGD